MDCVVLTYDTLHRKTYDTLCLLKASGYHNVVVWAVPMHYKKTFKPLYEHRPPLSNQISTEEVCANFHYQYVLSFNGYEDIPVDIEVPILSCGAGIIPQEIVEKYMIINSHPGYIPYARGLDSFKWAIYDDLPIGVTTHFLGDEVDAGKIIERREIPIYSNDTFHALAQRVYETEVEMLVGALEKRKGECFYEKAGSNILHKRMQPEQEIHLMERFQQMVQDRAEKQGGKV